MRSQTSIHDLLLCGGEALAGDRSGLRLGAFVALFALCAGGHALDVSVIRGGLEGIEIGGCIR